MPYALFRSGPKHRGTQVTSRRLIASLALVALAPAPAAAQFTTFVSPPPKVDTLIVLDSAGVPTADSVSRASIANMKAWVDSAAGNAVDLAAADTIPATTPATTPAPGGEVFGDGIPAPDTATPLPLLLTLGAGAIGAGAYLLRRR